MMNYTVLYVHGMGGGTDSRIPSVLNENINAALPDGVHIDVIVRTYSLDPEVAWKQIRGWFAELRPQLVMGESLGANHAIRLAGVPHILVSPSTGAARWMAVASCLPGAAAFMKMVFRPKEGDRQVLDFSRGVLKKYRGLWREVMACAPSNGGQDYFYAFFGSKDAYRRSGVVSIRSWRRHFGSGTYTIYEGTHYMEEEYLHTMLMPKILEVLGL